MNNLAAIKKRLAERKPFLTFNLYGEDNCLVQKGGDAELPLSIETVPPTMAWILETGMMTSLILRYSESYQQTVKDSGEELQGGQLSDKPEIAQKIMKEVADKLLSSDEEKIKQISTIISVGKEYLVRRTEHGWYGDREERFKVRFVMGKDEADLLNEQSEDALYVWVDNVSDLELVGIAGQLIDAMPNENQIANIPIQGETISGENTVSEVTESVPANKLATFPRNTRNIAVENVP
jgi:hypothetical protein